MNLQTPIARFYAAIDMRNHLESRRQEYDRAAREMSGGDEACALAVSRADNAKTMLESSKDEALALAVNLIEELLAQRRAA